ncbi:glutathione S-transferase Mu 1-like [Petromyzon marinus]|uniref:glutathione S-transferase Mu 1-like n=1 Tax=Petromyzon marinus TaxID=7757 RepID=UPI003F70D56C
MLENEAIDIRMALVYLFYGPDFLTYVDLVLYDVLNQHRLFEPSLLLPHPNLGQFLQRVEALDKISAFMKSSRIIKSPINNRAASWGIKKE